MGSGRPPVIRGGSGFGSSGVYLSSLSSDIIIETVETLGLGTVKVEPPVTDEKLLVENCPIRAEDTETMRDSLVWLSRG